MAPHRIVSSECTLRMSASTLLLLISTSPPFLLLFHNNHHATAAAYPIYPWSTFYLDFQNSFSKPSSTLQLNCSKMMTGTAKKLPPVVISQNDHWGFNFRKNWYPIHYICHYGCLGKTGNFEAWEDDSTFIDRVCGGRHCQWLAQDDGFYLLNLKDNKFHKRFKL